MKRYCLFLFLIFVFPSSFSASAQNISEWDASKQFLIDKVRSSSFLYKVEEEDKNDPFFYYDFEIDHLCYCILSKEEKTVSVGTPKYEYFYSDWDGWGNYAYVSDTTLKGTIELPTQVSYNDTLYTVTAISEMGFWFNLFIDSLIIPATITEIKDFAFHGSFIPSYTILGNSLKKVGVEAFETLGVYTDTVSNYQENDGIITRHCYMYSETPPEGVAFFSYKGFSKCDGLLHVPVGCKEAYQQAEGWKQYGENIVDDIELSGIHSSQVISNDSYAPTYDLQGRRVAHPKQGEIYIQKGKKIRK